MKKAAALTMLATLIGLTVPTPANAQQVCIVDRSNRVVCGRRATQWEINNGVGGSGSGSGSGGFQGNREQTRRDVERLYREVLGRSGDRSGVDTYVNRVTREGWSMSRVRSDMAYSQESRDNINDLYRKVLGRNADPGGISAYTRQLSEGKSLDWVRRDLERSPEATGRR